MKKFVRVRGEGDCRNVCMAHVNVLNGQYFMFSMPHNQYNRVCRRLGVRPDNGLEGEVEDGAWHPILEEP